MHLASLEASLPREGMATRTRMLLFKGCFAQPGPSVASIDAEAADCARGWRRMRGIDF